MIDSDLPVAPAADALARGFAACLASVTEVPGDEVPVPHGDLVATVATWRTWLAARGSGLVAVADPRRFQWTGWWIAVVRTRDDETRDDETRDDETRDDETRDDGPGGTADDAPEVAVLAYGTPPGVVLSPQRPALLGRATADLAVTAAYVVASLDPALRPAPAAPEVHGTVEAVAVAPVAAAEMEPVEVTLARAGRGLDGDRYAAGVGTFSPRGERRPGYDLTLVAAEALDGLAATGHPVTFTATRRNVLTRGVDLDALVGREFRIGDVLCAGRRRCEPCAHLERLGGPGLLRPLIHRGGLRVDVLTDGEVRRGAPIRLA